MLGPPPPPLNPINERIDVTHFCGRFKCAVVGWRVFGYSSSSSIVLLGQPDPSTYQELNREDFLAALASA